MNEHINKLADEINLLPLGTSAFIESEVDKKQTAFIIIKDKLQEVIYSYDRIEILCKCAFITNGNIMSSHLMLKMSCSEERGKFYPFHFNYFNEESLRIIVDLMKQKRLYIILCSENDECIELVYDNVIRKFFKGYIRRVLKLHHEWNDEQYEESIEEIIKTYGDLEKLWNRLGSEIELSEIQ